MIDRIKADQQRSVRRCCVVLGFRRKTYHRRKAGHRPDERDDALAAVLRATAEDKIAWGF
jgi:putative transposase